MQTQQYFSEQIDPDLAVIVKGIPAKHDRFVTDVFGDTDDEKSNYSWLEAWQNTSTGFWHIDQYTKMPDVMGDAVHKKKLSSLGICFFDALHFCSLFQLAEQEKGRIVIPPHEKTTGGLINFHEAATAAGQVIDSDGTAQPCANGRILTDGFFSGEALAIAKTSVSTTSTAVRVMPQRDLATVLLQGISVQPSQSNIPALEYGVQKRDLINAFKKVADLGDNLLSDLDNASKNGFRTAFGSPDKLEAYAATIFTAGIRSLIGRVTGSKHYNPEKYFANKVKDLKQACAALPDGPEKMMVADFAQAAGSIFYFERAVACYEECKNERKSGAKVKLGLDDIEQGAKLAGISVADIESLKNQYSRGDFPHGKLLVDLRKMWDPYIGAKTFFHQPWGQAYEVLQWEVKKLKNSDSNSEDDIKSSDLATALIPHFPLPRVDFRLRDLDDSLRKSYMEILADQYIKADRTGPMIRVAIHEKIKSLEANLE